MRVQVCLHVRKHPCVRVYAQVAAAPDSISCQYKRPALPVRSHMRAPAMLSIAECMGPVSHTCGGPLCILETMPWSQEQSPRAIFDLDIPSHGRSTPRATFKRWTLNAALDVVGKAHPNDVD